MDERDLFKSLSAAVRGGEVSVALDMRRLGHTDSPIAVQADSNQWIYAIMAATIAAWYWGNWWYSGLALAAGLLLYGLIGRRWIESRMRARFYERGIGELRVFKALWRIRGVTLTAGTASCASPEGDWRRFVLDHLDPAGAKDARGRGFAGAGPAVGET